jgi:RecA/RadA recombinase
MSESVLDKAKKLNKEFQSDTLALKADVTPAYKRFACGDLGMDYPLFGGLPEGRIIVYSGKQHSGKTTAACVEMGAYQREYPDKVCVFVDVEHSLDLEFQSAMTGIDLTKLVYVNPENMSGEQILDTICEFEDADDIGMIILDSIPALTSALEMENDVETDKGKAGNMAKSISRFIRKMLSPVAAKKNIVILINQVREVGKTFTNLPIYDEPGGAAPKYYSSVTVRFGTRTFTQGDVVDKNDGEKADGFRLKFAITKNKTASTQRGGGFLTFRYDKGLDWMFDTLEVAMKYGFINRPTNQMYQLINPTTGEVLKAKDGTVMEFRGQAKLKEYLGSNPEFQKEYLSMLNKAISESSKKYGSLLDDRALAEINNEEASISSDSDSDSPVSND